MDDTAKFINVKRKDTTYRPAAERVKDYREVAPLRGQAQSMEQASRCMNCGLPFCHWVCPAGNYIPDWNNYIARGEWENAYRALQATNNIPEITGRLCPAPCEYGCVLNIKEGDAVTSRENELAVIEHAFREGLVKPNPPQKRTKKSVAVVGSGPAGLCCADQLNKAGHRVVVFERDELPGGILRYGIPDFKLEKWIIDRRLKIWEAEGIEFVTGVNVGVDFPVSKLRADFDAACLAGGSCIPRDLAIEGRKLHGIHFAMDYLVQSNRKLSGKKIPDRDLIDANGKQVVVIGGGDTGADCVGTAHRQGARRVVQVEILSRPPENRGPNDLWPDYPIILKKSSSHEEGGDREWSVLTKCFIGNKECVKKLSCVRVSCIHADKSKPPRFEEIAGSQFEIEADLVILAMGFVSPEKDGLLNELKVRLDPRGNAATDENFMTSIKGVFAAGDMHRGQSLIVWAVDEGRKAAEHINRYLLTGHKSS